MNTSRILSRLTAFSVFALTAVMSAKAQVFFPNNATIDYAIPQITRVGYANATDFATRSNPTNPTVDVVAGANIFDLRVYNSSFLNMSDGFVNDYIQATNNATVNISGGTLNNQLRSFNTSTVNITGGTIGAAFPGGLQSFDTSTVNVSGGSILGIFAYGFSTANISGGNVNGPVRSDDRGTINFSGGSIEGELLMGNFCMTNITGGSLGGNLTLNGRSLVTIRGGSIGGNIVVNYSSVLNFYGTNLSAMLLSLPGSEFNEYRLSGNLLDGMSIDGQLVSVQGFIPGVDPAALNLFNVVPEPGSFAMLIGGSISGSLFLLRRRKNRNSA